jgi:hypothetical protein
LADFAGFVFGAGVLAHSRSSHARTTSDISVPSAAHLVLKRVLDQVERKQESVSSAASFAWE